ncbi:MAG: acyltransferase family protein [Fluviicola sp.]|jgi:glucan biosynthesis protein C
MRYLEEFDRYRIVLHVLRCFMHLTVPFMVIPSQIWPFKSEFSHNETADGFVFIVHVGIMEAFFLLNGFFAMQLLERKTTKQFVLNRVRRIVVPFVLGIVVMVPIILTLGLSKKNKVPLLESFPLLKSFLAEHPINFGPYWSLWYLILLYVLFLVLEINFQFFSKRIKQLKFSVMLGLVLLFASTSLFFFFRKYTLLPIDTLLDWQMILYYFSIFSFGVWIYFHQDIIERIKKVYVIAILTIIAFAINVWFQKTEHPSTVFRIIGVFCYVFQSLGLAVLVFEWIKKWKFGSVEKNKTLSQSMYWLYWIEVPIAIAIHYFFLDSVHPLIIVLGGGIFTFSVSIISFKLLLNNKFLGKLLGFSN